MDDEKGDEDSGGSDSEPQEDDLQEIELQKLHNNILFIIENFNKPSEFWGTK